MPQALEKIAAALASAEENPGGVPLPGFPFGKRGERSQPGADILYVEDDDAWAALVECWVGFMGLTIKRVRDCAEFKAYVLGCRPLPRCLLLDLRLGEDSGLDLCDEIKRSPRLQAIPVVLLTGTKVKATDAFRHRALHCVKKSHDTEAELRAALQAILEQQDRAQGVVDAGALRLDGRTGGVYEYGELVVTLDPGFFAAFRLLIQAAPEVVPENELYAAFLSRIAYRTDDPETAARGTLRNYVSRLRRLLGERHGARILSVGRGYVLGPDRYISN